MAYAGDDIQWGQSGGSGSDFTDYLGGDFVSAGLDYLGMGPRPGRRAANAARDAANTQRMYGEQANEFLSGRFGEAQNSLRPYEASGSYGLQGLMSDRFNTQDPGQYQGPEYDDPGQFNLADLRNDEGYKFRLDAGLDALQGRIAGAGGRGGGNAMKAYNDYAQGFASNEAGAAFDRFSNQRDFGRNKYMDDRDSGYGQFADRYNRQFQNNQQNIGRYSGLANMGFDAAGRQSGNAMDYGQMYGNNLMGIGNSMAAGQVGAANARNQAGQNNFSGMTNLLALLKG